MGSYRWYPWYRCQEGTGVGFFNYDPMLIVSYPVPLFRYFLAAKPSIERHVFSVAIPTSSSAKLVEPKALTDTAKPGYYSARFSPEAGFYVLNYIGPGIPWTKVVDVDSCEAHILEHHTWRRLRKYFLFPSI